MKLLCSLSLFHHVHQGHGACVHESVRAFGCAQISSENSTFDCQQVMETSSSAAYPTIVADEYHCKRCLSLETTGSANPSPLLNCTLSRTCDYDDVIVDHCSIGTSSSLSCSKTEQWSLYDTKTPFIKCSGDVCNSTVVSPLVDNCRKCYSSNLIGVNCAIESPNKFFTCNQYYTFDAVQVVSSMAGTNYAFVSGVYDMFYQCDVLLCVDSAGDPLYDLDTVMNCTYSNPPLGQGYQY